MPLAEHEDALARRGQKVLLLDDGGVLAFDTIAVAEGKVALEGPAFGKAALEMSAASALYFPAREQTPAGARKRHLEMNLPAANTDFLVVEDGKARWVPVAGVLKGIEGGKVSFQFEGENRTTDLSAVRVIQLARVPRKAAAPAGRLTCRDGSEAAFAALSFDGTCFSAAADGMALPAVDTAAVAEIRFQSDRFVYLSDLKPAQVSQAGMFELVFPFRADRSSAGRPLRLGKTVYAKGVGMHSRCELTYDLHGKYATFAALAGIDATGGTRGNAALRILGDGRELLPAVKLLGGAAAIPLRCAVSGVKQLTVIADFGEDATDIGDHVDLADARLIKP